MENDPENERPGDNPACSQTNRKADRRPRAMASEGPVFQYSRVGSGCSVMSNTSEERTLRILSDFAYIKSL